MIRYGNKFDFPVIYSLLEHFCRQHKFEILKDETTWSRSHVEKQLSIVLAGAGFILIAEDGSGFLVALKAPCFFIENAFSLHEIIWHAKNDKTSIKLLKNLLKLAMK